MKIDHCTDELARIYEDQQYLAKARACYRLLLDRDPDDPALQASLRRVEAGIREMGAMAEAAQEKKPEKSTDALACEWAELVILKHRLDGCRTVRDRLISCQG